MRAILIAGVILMFCFAADMVNQVEALHFGEMGVPIFGWTVQAPISPSDLPFIGSASAYNQSMSDALTPQEQPSGLSGYGDLFSGMIAVFIGGWIILGALFNSTIGFFFWIQNLGRADFVFMPVYMAAPISAIVYFIYIIAIVQWRAGRNGRQGL